MSEVPTETILFNIDAKSPMGKDQDAILRVFTKVFYEHCGYYGDDMKVAALERFLDRQGRLEAFKAAFEAVNTEPWATAREAFAFWEDDVVAALTQTAGMSETAARNWFNGEENADMSIERLGREIAEYVDGKAPNFHLVFLVDEIGQYIGDNSGMMLNLQTLVEELGSRCKGKVGHRHQSGGHRRGDARQGQRFFQDTGALQHAAEPVLRLGGRGHQAAYSGEKRRGGGAASDDLSSECLGDAQPVQLRQGHAPRI